MKSSLFQSQIPDTQKYIAVIPPYIEASKDWNDYKKLFTLEKSIWSIAQDENQLFLADSTNFYSKKIMGIRCYASLSDGPTVAIGDRLCQEFKSWELTYFDGSQDHHLLTGNYQHDGPLSPGLYCAHKLCIEGYWYHHLQGWGPREANEFIDAFGIDLHPSAREWIQAKEPVIEKNFFQSASFAGLIQWCRNNLDHANFYVKESRRNRGERIAGPKYLPNYIEWPEKVMEAFKS